MCFNLHVLCVRLEECAMLFERSVYLYKCGVCVV